MRILSDLLGTLQSSLRIGTVQIKNASNTIQARNAADTANVPFTASIIAAIAADGKRSGFKVAEGMSADVDYELPAADGASGQVLATNAAGVLSWATVATGANAEKTQIETIGFGTSSPVTIFTPPANARIEKVTVNVTEAFNGTSPSMSVGVAGTTARYMGTTDILLATIGQYEVSPLYTEDASPEAVIVTFNAGAGASAGSCEVSVTYSNPS